MVEMIDSTQEQPIQSQALFHETYGNNASTMISPKNEEEISVILQEANHQGKQVTIISGGTKRGFGGTKESYDQMLSMANYKGIVEHTVGDMTITVKAGTTISELQKYLMPHKQMVSIDPSWPEQATIGGVIAANESGPKRLKYGSARDLVIGLRVVYSDGKVIRTGGKVVKNVAGYDMNKLFIGSMGTLGVLSEITLKLRPKPKYESLVIVSVSEEALDGLKSFAVDIQDALIDPTSLEILNPSLAKKLLNRDEYVLLIAFEDVEKAVFYQEEWIDQHKPERAFINTFPQDKARDFWQTFAGIKPNSLQDRNGKETTKIVIKIGSKNMDVLEIMKKCNELCIQNDIKIEGHGGLGHGISHYTLDGSEQGIQTVIINLRHFVEEKNGYVILEHAQLQLRKVMNVWGTSPSYAFLFEGIKRKVDPTNILNHQRFVGGI